MALVNNAGAAHLGGLGSVENVARAKGEIFAGLGDHGVAVINADDAHAAAVAHPGRPNIAVLDFGLEHDAAISGSYRAQRARQ